LFIALARVAAACVAPAGSPSFGPPSLAPFGPAPAPAARYLTSLSNQFAHRLDFPIVPTKRNHRRLGTDSMDGLTAKGFVARSV
jgi:hypothetical protein